MNHMPPVTPEQIAAEGMRRAEMDRRIAAAGGEVPGKSGKAPAAPLTTVDPTSLWGVAVPPREWIVQDWLPVGYVTLLYADGGTGKTLLTQQLATSCATGTPWCGLAVEPCRAFCIFCEDDEGEMHRRQDDICRATGLHFGELGNMRWACPVGQDNALVRFESDNELVLTDRFLDLLAQVKAFGARLVIIDTAADTFPGNENDRGQVRQFIGHALTRIAQEIGGAVLVNAHPSRSGMSASGNLDGGSTGWSNSARSRWSLTRPDAEEGSTVEEDLRILTRRKSNHASIGDQIKLRWADGALMPEGRPVTNGNGAALRQAQVESVFLALLASCTASGINLSMSQNSTNFAPRVFAKRPDRKGCTRREFDAVMPGLVAAGRIRMETYGRKGDCRSRIAAVPETPGAEEAAEE